MKRDLARWTKECRSCARSKVQRHNHAQVCSVVPPPKGRLTNVYIDINGPLGNSSGYQYLLVIIDRYTRFISAVPLAGITSEECIDAFLHHWVAWAGCPQHIFTDRGAQFTSGAWKKMCAYIGAKLHFSSPYHPQAQGLIERFNRTLKNSLRAHEDGGAWFDHLPWVLLALRNAPKQTLNCNSPSELLFGEPVRMPGAFFEEQNSNGYNEPSSDFAANLSAYVHNFRYHPPRPPRDRNFVDPKLFNSRTTHVYVRVDKHRPPLSPVYKGPYRILDRYSKYFILDFLNRYEQISVDRLKVAPISLQTLDEEMRAYSTAPTVGDNFNASVSPESADLASDVEVPSVYNESGSSTPYSRSGRTIRPPAYLNDYVL